MTGSSKIKDTVLGQDGQVGTDIIALSTHLITRAPKKLAKGVSIKAHLVPKRFDPEDRYLAC